MFKLTSAKFQTFDYNSRTVRSSHMNFWQQFEINEFGAPKIKFFTVQARVLVFLISVDIWQTFWHSLGVPPPVRPPNITFLNSLS